MSFKLNARAAVNHGSKTTRINFSKADSAEPHFVVHLLTEAFSGSCTIRSAEAVNFDFIRDGDRGVPTGDVLPAPRREETGEMLLMSIVRKFDMKFYLVLGRHSLGTKLA